MTEATYPAQAALNLCERLEWDTSFFGFPIARYKGSSWSAAQAEAAEAWCLSHQIHCLYYLVDTDRSPGPEQVETRGYKRVDVRLTLKRSDGLVDPVAPAASARVRSAILEDLPQLENIARQSFHNTRFYFDSKFPRDLCDKLYVTWIKLSFEGQADQVFVAELNNVAQGFVTCQIDDSGGRIGLLGVAAEARGQGLGRLLVRAALNWLRERGIATISVVTQERNIQALYLYQRAGFKIVQTQVWFHKWFV